MGYMIGTGWWCPETKKEQESAGKRNTEWRRMKTFYDLWLRHIRRYTFPSGIVVVDAGSEMLPDFSGMHVLKMSRNFQHENGSKGLFGTERTGGIRQIFLAGMYAMVNGADYFVWVEGDCLLHGTKIIEKVIRHMGDGDFSALEWNHEYKLETSFMVFRCSSLPKIMARYLVTDASKPELKFVEVAKHFKLVWMPFGYGRNRPIDFDVPHYFAQHVYGEELAEFKKRLEC